MDSLAVDTRNDRFILIVLGLSLVVSLGLAGWYSTWAEALVIGGLSFFGAFAVYQMMPGSLLSRMTNALALMMMVALHIHQARGMIEMHFGVRIERGAVGKIARAELCARVTMETITAR